MRISLYLSIFYFVFFVVLSLIRPLSPGARVKAIAFGGIGLFLIGAVETASLFIFAPHASFLRDWFPAMLMPVAYWQAGSFFTRPNAWLQDRLHAFDRRVISKSFLYSERRSAFAMETVFELAYALCYPLVPAGVAALYIVQMSGHVESYWLIVLPSSYVCYGLLPFFQTLPPRAIEPAARSGFNTAVRGFNFWLLRHVSIRANTFPSAHVAASFAAALALLQFAPSLGIIFSIVGVAIAFATVLGRYHYALDAIAGALVAGGVFGVISLLRLWLG